MFSLFPSQFSWGEGGRKAVAWLNSQRAIAGIGCQAFWGVGNRLFELGQNLCGGSGNLLGEAWGSIKL